MLVARGGRTLGSAKVAYALAFGRGIWVKVIASRGLVLDTRFVPASPGPAKPSSCLLLLATGQFLAYGAERMVHDGPTAIRLSHEQLEGADRRRSFEYRTSGEPAKLIEVHFGQHGGVPWPSRPAPLPLDAQTWASVEQACDLDQPDSAKIVDSVHAFLRHLAAQGIIHSDVIIGATGALPKPVVRLWEVIEPLVTSYAVSSTLDDLVTAGNLSSGQVERLLQRFLSMFSIVGPGLRSVTYHVRMKTAVLFLSSPTASVAEVAELCGYGSPDAMARAFRDANLPPPSVVQKKILEDLT